MEERFEAFTVLIARLSRSIRRIKAEEMADFGLKVSHVSCLYYLHCAGALTASELCERCEEDKAAVSRAVDELESGGYLTGESSGKKRYKTKKKSSHGFYSSLTIDVKPMSGLYLRKIKEGKK